MALDVEKYLAEEAKERQRLAGELYGMNHPKQEITQNFGEAVVKESKTVVENRHSNEATAQAAKIVGTNRQYVSDAKRLEKQAP